jgi:Actinobacteria/chloroflexi VLRF1 release factor
LITVQPKHRSQKSTLDRTVRVAPERLARWLTGFEERHGKMTVSQDGGQVMLSAADGAQAVITMSFPPPPVGDSTLDDLVQHVSVERQVGALLVRKGGYAVGVFAGRELIRSKVGSSYVQGRTRAGGWSQQRFARRRENQASKAYQLAADAASAVLLPAVDDLETVFLGGDRPGVEGVLADSRLSPVRAKVGSHVLPVAEPRLAVLRAFPDQFLAVLIRLNDLA